MEMWQPSEIAPGSRLASKTNFSLGSSVSRRLSSDDGRAHARKEFVFSDITFTQSNGGVAPTCESAGDRDRHRTDVNALL